MQNNFLINSESGAAIIMPPPNLIKKTYDHHHNATNIINNLGKEKKSTKPQLKFKRTDVAPRAHRKQASSGV